MVMIVLEHSKFYTLRHSNNEKRFLIDFGQKVVSLSFCQLLALRNKINNIAIEALLDPEINPHGLYILTLCNNEHLFVLNTFEVLDMKTLLQNSFAAMGLSKKIVPVTL